MAVPICVTTMAVSLENLIAVFDLSSERRVEENGSLRLFCHGCAEKLEKSADVPALCDECFLIKRADADAIAVEVGRPPRYDAVFEEGAAWLDSLAGEEIPKSSGGRS